MKRHLIVGLFALLLVIPALAQSPDYHGENDGPVFMAFDPQGTMWATWSFLNGLEYDIAVSQRVGETWTFPELLGVGNNRNDLDPRISFTPNSTPILVWWEEATEEYKKLSVFSYLTPYGWKTYAPLIPGSENSHPNLISASDDSFVFSFLDADGIAFLGNIKFVPIKKPKPKTNGGSNGPDPMPTIIQRKPPLP